jgi:hypothetical protein
MTSRSEMNTMSHSSTSERPRPFQGEAYQFTRVNKHGQDIEGTRATRACVGEDAAWGPSDQGAYVGQKIGRYRDAVREVFKIWSAAAAAGNGNPSRRLPASTVANAE